MRQLTTPVRLAELAVTVLVLTASAGCMSVSDNQGGPKPSASAGRHGDPARADEGKGGPGVGRGRAGKHDPKAPGGPAGSPSASGSPEAQGAAATPSPGAPKPGGGPGPAKPPQGGPSRPAPSPSHPVPPTPPASPSPSPVIPTPPASPSTTPGADTHTSALRGIQAPIEQEPTASPQVGPV
ncbi:hypothetical protein ACIBCO_07725 [Streptomyces violascens]|uniref:hypothetical protein n=1 Tax=Streptomyces violascens TaxID=67381 RepID=UPI00379D5604